MIEAILAALGAQARARARHAGYSAALAAVAAVLVAIAVAALVGALFLALKLSLTPIEAALAIAAGALVLAVAVSSPLWWPKRRPPPRPEPTLAEFVALVASKGTSFTPRQLALGAVLGALALGLMAGGVKKDEEVD
jgi:hypothetical protein